MHIRAPHFHCDLLSYVASLDIEKITAAINRLGAGEPAQAPGLLSQMPHIGPVDMVSLEIFVERSDTISLEGVFVRFSGSLIGDATAYVNGFPLTCAQVKTLLIESADKHADLHSDRDLSIIRSPHFGGDIREYVTSIDFAILADAINQIGSGEYAEAENLLTRTPHRGQVKRVCVQLEVSHSEERSLAEGIRVRFDGFAMGSATAYIDRFPVSAQDIRIALLSSANAQADQHHDLVD